MYKIVIKNEADGQLLWVGRIKKMNRFFSDVLAAVKPVQLEQDVLGLGKPCQVADLGIRSAREERTVKVSTDNQENTGIEIWDSEKREYIKTGQKIAVMVYPEGYVIATGKTAENIFGFRHPVYLKTIGTRSASMRTIHDCHIFPSLKSVEKYALKHRDSLEYLIEEYGYAFSVEHVNQQFADDMRGSDTEKLEEVNQLLASFEKDDAPDPETATKEAEAEYRLKKLKIKGMNPEESSSFQVSDAGREPLDAHGQEAVKSVLEFGGFPYYVMVTNASFGKCYSVLYVSSSRDEWEMERPSRDGWIAAYVFNADYPDFSEIGDIQVKAVKGRLIRIG